MGLSGMHDRLFFGPSSLRTQVRWNASGQSLDRERDSSLGCDFPTVSGYAAKIDGSACRCGVCTLFCFVSVGEGRRASVVCRARTWSPSLSSTFTTSAGVDGEQEARAAENRPNRRAGKQVKPENNYASSECHLRCYLSSQIN